VLVCSSRLGHADSAAGDEAAPSVLPAQDTVSHAIAKSCP